MLDGQPLSDAIAADLVPATISTIDAVPLDGNGGRSFQGVIPGHDGFVIDNRKTATRLRSRNEAAYYNVVLPYLIGDDIAEDINQHPRRWIIDFTGLVWWAESRKVIHPTDHQTAALIKSQRRSTCRCLVVVEPIETRMNLRPSMIEVAR